jgi:hypothetical protein
MMGTKTVGAKDSGLAGAFRPLNRNIIFKGFSPGFLANLNAIARKRDFLPA